MFRSLFLDDGDAAGGGVAAPPAPVAAPVPAAAAPAPAAPAAPAPPARGTGMTGLRNTLDSLRERVVDDRTIPAAETPPATPAAVVPAAEVPAAEVPAVETATGEAPVTTEATAEEVPFVPVTITLPPVRPGQEPLEIVADDPEAAEEMRDAAERIAHLTRNGVRKEELQRRVMAIDKQKAELDYIEDSIALDPVGFIDQKIPQEMQVEVALSILAKDGVLDALMPVIEKWVNDPKDRQLDGFKAQQAREVKQRQASEKLTARQAERIAVHRITSTVDAVQALVPADMQGQFTDDLLRDVQEASARDGRVPNATPEQLIQMLAPRLQLYGVKLDAALAALKSPSTPGLPEARPKGEIAERIAATADAARTTGVKFRSASAARRTAAIVPTPGAGGSPPTVVVPKQGVKDRISWLKERFRGQ